jgi:hypothetical protein
LSVHFASLGVKTQALPWLDALVQATPSLHTQSVGQVAQLSQLASHTPSPQSDTHVPLLHVVQAGHPQSTPQFEQVSQFGSHAPSPQLDSQTPMLQVCVQG